MSTRIRILTPEDGARLYTPVWQASTAYGTGDVVVSPTGDVVIALNAHTSGVSFDQSHWAFSTSIQTLQNQYVPFVREVGTTYPARPPGAFAIFVGKDQPPGGGTTAGGAGGINGVDIWLKVP